MRREAGGGRREAGGMRREAGGRRQQQLQQNHFTIIDQFFIVSYQPKVNIIDL